MQKIQSGCIQTFLDSWGRATNYKLMLPLPREAVAIPFPEGCKLDWVNRKGYLTFESEIHGEVMDVMTKAQINITTWKQTQLSNRLAQLKDRLEIGQTYALPQ